MSLAEAAYPCLVNLRGKPGDKAFGAAAKKALGVAAPVAPNRVVDGQCGGKAVKIFWLSPEEWWVQQTPGEAGEETSEAEQALAAHLREALAGVHAAVTEVGESRTRIVVAGPRARVLLAKGCPLDLHPREFGEAGQCAQTVMAKAGVLIHLLQTESEAEPAKGPVFELFVLRSFAAYLWHWLDDAAREYGAEAG